MVFSLILKTPPIVISWSDKYNDIMSSFEIEKYCVKDSGKAEKTIDNLLSNFQNIQEKIKHNLNVNSLQIDKSLSLFLDLLNKQLK